MLALLGQALDDAAALGQTRAAAAAEYDRAESTFLQINAEYARAELAFFREQAGLLARGGLQAGAACPPVCGSTEHPPRKAVVDPQAPTQAELGDLKKRTEQARAAMEKRDVWPRKKHRTGAKPAPAGAGCRPAFL